MNSPSRILNTVVIKVGTDVITTPEGALNVKAMRSIVEQIVSIRERVARVVLVSSGAVAAGRAILGRKRRTNETVPEKQKYAFVGQVPLMSAWARLFKKKGIVVGQGLLTGKNFDSKSERHHIHEGLEEVFRDRVPIIPIFNENDLVATRELKLTDNDELAGHIAQMIGAQKVLLLSTIRGIQRNLQDPTTVIRTVPVGSRECEQYVQPSTSDNGIGGADTKVRVGQELSIFGIETTIASGNEPNVIPRVMINGERLGTTFLAVVRIS